MLCPTRILTTPVSFDLASPPTKREWKHQQQLLDIPGSLQAHTEGNARETDGTALVQALNNQHIVTVQTDSKMAPMGDRWQD